MFLMLLCGEIAGFHSGKDLPRNPQAAESGLDHDEVCKDAD
jgi:hypothetical protein